MMEFVYRGKNYSWDEWKHEYHNFTKSMELPEDFHIDPNIREFSLIQDIGYSIAIDKYHELYEMIANSRFALINSFQKFYESNIISWNNPYMAHLWMRFQYLKNAIVWYNSCEDYIYQILWFAYDLHSIIISSKENYLRILKECSYGKIISILKNNEDKNNDAKVLKEKMIEYREDPDVLYLREELANNLKHRANIQVLGLENTRLMGFVQKAKDGSDIFNSAWIEPIIIDIDNIIELVRRVHTKLIEYGRFVLNFMNIDNIFITDEKGQGILNKIKNKGDYKKIVISNP